MRAVFADTFFWIALLNPRDSGHLEAMRWIKQNQDSKIVTTDEVIIELLNAFSELGPHYRKQAAQYVRSLLAGSIVDVFEQSRHSFEEGLALYLSRLDKGYSLTDCVSMSLMHRIGITDVLTRDLHFNQEGYVTLFR